MHEHNSRCSVERRVLVSTTARQRQSERWFFGGIALASILAVFVGFAPTYYLKGVFGTPPLSLLVHLHGALSTMWLLLLLLQTSLVAAGRTDIHRRMGIGAVLLIPAMLVVGPAVAIAATRRGIPNAPPALGLELLFTPVSGIVLFAILAAVGLYNRRKRDAHTRSHREPRTFLERARSSAFGPEGTKDTGTGRDADALASATTDVGVRLWYLPCAQRRGTNNRESQEIGYRRQPIHDARGELCDLGSCSPASSSLNSREQKIVLGVRFQAL
jgi:hypothetical protein